MPTRRLPGALILLAVIAAPALAQGGAIAPRQLSLAQALGLARTNSPTYLQAQLTADPAAEAVKQANWALLPTVSASTGASYTGAGSSTFGGTTFNQSSPSLQSNYSISANLQLSTRAFLTPSIQKAQLRATNETIAAASVTLISDVTSQYLNTLRAAALVNVAVQQLASDTVSLELAQVRQRVGQVSLIDVLQAQTTLANAQVTWLQQVQLAAQAKVELIRRLGLGADANADSIVLTEQFPLVEPHYDLATLTSMAHESNPTVRSLQATTEANQLSTKAARLDRLPTLSISTGLNGYTFQETDENLLINQSLQGALSSASNCAFQNQILEGLTTPITGGIIPDCNAYAGLNPSGTALQQSILTQIHTSNNVFPFNFTRQPISVSFQLSVPIWDAYSHSLRISQAAATEDESRETLRAQRLLTDETIQSNLLTVKTAWQTITIQDSNRVAARQQLQLAQDKYRIGNGTAVDIATAQTTVTQAEVNYVTAVFDYHLAVASLEAAVGRPLR